MRGICALLALGLVTAGAAKAQEALPRHEVGLTLGGLFSSQRTGGPTQLDLASGIALQANYGVRLSTWRFLRNNRAALYGEVHLLASPLRDVSSQDTALTRNVASLFITPGLRLKFFPNRRIAPFIAAGGGFADFEQSTTTLAGAPNPAQRHVNRGAFDFGGGADFKFWRFIGLRAELRDFYTGSPDYNTTAIAGGQHNVVASGGLLLKFR